jgi:catechol 2,3-dioxygenase-like lactoylglutathione lyase family enzyme
VIIGIQSIGLTVRQQTDVDPLLAALGARALGDSQGNVHGWAAGNLTLEVSLSDRFDALSPAPRVHESGITHICLQARDHDALWAELQAGGVRFNAEMTTLGNGTWYAYGTTPAGFVVEVESAEYVPADGPDTWIAHVALCTHDLERLSAFYASLTGRPWFGGVRVRKNTANDRITGLADVDLKVAWVACGNIMIEFWQYLSPVTEPRHQRADNLAGLNAITFEVTDLEAVRAHLEACGMAEVEEVIGPDGHPCLMGHDPDGNRLLFRASTDGDARALAAAPAFGWMAHLNDIRSTLTTLSFRPKLSW